MRRLWYIVVDRLVDRATTTPMNESHRAAKRARALAIGAVAAAGAASFIAGSWAAMPTPRPTVDNDRSASRRWRTKSSSARWSR